MFKFTSAVFIVMALTNAVIEFVDNPPVVQETAGGPR
jgi:hypothetical protein